MSDPVYIYIYIYIYIYASNLFLSVILCLSLISQLLSREQDILETLTLNDEYENFLNAHTEAVAECIPIKLRAKHRVPWETLAVKKKT